VNRNQAQAIFIVIWQICPEIHRAKPVPTPLDLAGPKATTLAPMRTHETTQTAATTDSAGAEFLRLPSVVRRTGLGRSTIYKLIAEHKFPSPVRLSGRAVGWRCSDLDRWSEARPTISH
jgi:prophage regulatory protein